MSKPKSRTQVVTVDSPASVDRWFPPPEAQPVELVPLFAPAKRYFFSIWYPGRLRVLLDLLNREGLLLHSVVPRPMTDQVLAIVERGGCALDDDAIDRLISEAERA